MSRNALVANRWYDYHFAAFGVRSVRDSGEIDMPVEVAIWKLSAKADRVSFESMPSDSQREDILTQDTHAVGQRAAGEPRAGLLGRRGHWEQ